MCHAVFCQQWTYYQTADQANLFMPGEFLMHSKWRDAHIHGILVLSTYTKRIEPVNSQWKNKVKVIIPVQNGLSIATLHILDEVGIEDVMELSFVRVQIQEVGQWSFQH
ncbi:hypothetical protein EDD17DRAFT_1505827 [Pisolithus thermaeus]|nr:hypothetical protein EDD17DRAFT_1505827 [Pisolithus thermaeus]